MNMDATRAIRQDHELLRKKLTILGSALQVAPEVRFVLREMSFSLQHLLSDHARREARALELYNQRLPAGSRVSPGRDHADVQHLLRGVNELLLGGMRASLSAVVTRLSEVIDRLEAQMDEQERTVFEFLDHAEPSPVDGAPRERDAEAIESSMSANEILQRFPQTVPLFERLHIDRLQEGYDSVDEIAWHHGLDASQFLEQLRQAVASVPAKS
ncbi:MAG: hypothetical protein A3B78_02515 [Omnitrophica WOR_2 bacterium RIFCSPHIGHO2_02_FULL_67_20]|nr:MAG: hypothetical protein A3B78_02515 [Omnitrophica WOR_2 bacterium RIFCSPHIGHO2_02_FULL_67_20]